MSVTVKKEEVESMAPDFTPLWIRDEAEKRMQRRHKIEPEEEETDTEWLITDFKGKEQFTATCRHKAALEYQCKALMLSHRRRQEQQEASKVDRLARATAKKRAAEVHAPDSSGAQPGDQPEILAAAGPSSAALSAKDPGPLPPSGDATAVTPEQPAKRAPHGRAHVAAEKAAAEKPPVTVAVRNLGLKPSAYAAPTGDAAVTPAVPLAATGMVDEDMMEIDEEGSSSSSTTVATTVEEVTVMWKGWEPFDEEAAAVAAVFREWSGSLLDEDASLYSAEALALMNEPLL